MNLPNSLSSVYVTGTGVKDVWRNSHPATLHVIR
jgi:hypothetical protein